MAALSKIASFVITVIVALALPPGVHSIPPSQQSAPTRIHRSAGQQGFSYQLADGGVLEQFERKNGTLVRMRPLKEDVITAVFVENELTDFLVIPRRHLIYCMDMHGLDAYKYTATGTTTPFPPYSRPALSHPMKFSVSPDRRYVYVSSSHGMLQVFRLQRNGSLNLLSNGKTYAGAVDPGRVTFSRNGRYAAVWVNQICSATNSVRVKKVFSVQKDGSLRPIREKS